ncbi:nuclear transport factor 2 family protein [Chitinophaga sp. Cy-1792]|uniref:nuclear transport factor 2 family protein n=1 Tax=Chitinophaga sp. Cy-1792 TaxID=2608339 RepID=UPI00141E3787|nr:nuclear transport factor 2 family protein [Chitinophaga sp. Cy-1792]NIG54420.1 nuclear transport factor 2 family protein [Chitinophaga sp. Cy-1792]
MEQANINRDIAASLLTAMGNRDIAAILSFFGENTDWYIPGDEANVPWLGKRQYKSEIADFYKLLWENTVPIDASIAGIFTNGNQVVISGEFTTLMTKKKETVQSMFFIHMIIENGLITRYRLLEDSFAVSAAM